MRTITSTLVSTLRAEAGNAGDTEGVLLCDRWLAGDASAESAIAEWLDQVAAMGGDDTAESGSVYTAR